LAGTMREVSGVISSTASTAKSTERASVVSGSCSIHHAGSLSLSPTFDRSDSSRTRTTRPRTSRLRPSAYCNSECWFAGIGRSCQHQKPMPTHKAANGTDAIRRERFNPRTTRAEANAITVMSTTAGCQVRAIARPTANQHAAASNGARRNRRRSASSLAQNCSAWAIRTAPFSVPQAQRLSTATVSWWKVWGNMSTKCS